MTSAHAAPEGAAALAPDGATATASRVPRRSLRLARAAWVVLALLSAALLARHVVASWPILRTPCAEGGCVLAPQLTVDSARALRRLGVSRDAYAALRLALDVAFGLGFFAAAGLIFRRRSAEPMGLFAAFMLVAFASAFAGEALKQQHPAWRPAIQPMNSFGFNAFFIFWYLFPDGRFVPRWTRPLVAVWLAADLSTSYLPPDSPLNLQRYPWLFLPLFAGLVGSCVVAQAYRYRRVSGPVQRQQTKWVAFGFGAATVVFLAWVSLRMSPALVQPGVPRLLYDLGTEVVGLVFLLVPLSIGVAILRYRLWDIDILINRALVYGALTACVVGLYVLVVGGLGALFQARGSLLISLLATGLVAVLFQPLRERLQRGVNRLVYGERDEPYAVLSRLGQRLEGTLGPRPCSPPSSRR